MPIHKTHGLVLSRRHFRETSLIANFFTLEFGKISGILKGIKADPHKFASTVETFSYNEVVFYKSREASLHLISHCDIRESFPGIRSNIEKITCASLMMELLDAVMAQEDKNEEIFSLALNSLKALETTHNPERILTVFKIKALALSGFKPCLDSCVSCANRIFGPSRFSLKLGGLLCEKCYTKDNCSRAIYRGTIASVLHIEKNPLKNSLNLGMNPQIKKELDLLLNSFLNFHLEKELNAQKVSHKLNNFINTGRVLAGRNV